ncbi:hypothetical protein AB0C07_06000 [Actinoplanes missouriensis]|uniref:hypothetical protein n=1 Tax=Actinoplanes missouriensis TaxID=1866 RepID=UPI0033E06958
MVEVKARSNRDAPGFRLSTLPYAIRAVDDHHELGQSGIGSKRLFVAAIVGKFAIARSR